MGDGKAEQGKSAETSERVVTASLRGSDTELTPRQVCKL